MDMAPEHDGYVDTVPSSAELVHEGDRTDVPPTVMSINVSFVHVDPHTPHVPKKSVDIGGTVTAQ
jgi:hypothetical protein